MKGLVGHAKTSRPQVLNSCQPRKVVNSICFLERWRKRWWEEDPVRTVDGQSLHLILGKREVKFEQQKGRATGMETHG